ncbi:MAG: Hsp20/alpha crystallin family protein [Myxococcales bacterium]|nr:MAG: Hsp20/alpha crystallin family protein [Myxococcales bacterium]
MTRKAWDSYRNLLEIRNRMADLFQESLNQFDYISADQHEDASWAPPFDVVETEEEICIYGEVSGLTKENLSVQLRGNELVITGERRPDMPGDATSYHLAERVYGTFQRIFRLTENISEHQVSTQLKDGLLEIHLAKHKPRLIPIE